MKQTSLLMRPGLTALTRAGTKTQTRRTSGLKEINEAPDAWRYGGVYRHAAGLAYEFRHLCVGPNKFIKCPYGDPGDLIYLKEPHYLYGFWSRTGRKRKCGLDKWAFERVDPYGHVAEFDKPKSRLKKSKEVNLGWYKRSPLFMAKVDARTWAKITGISLGRLQNISVDDCFREGIKRLFGGASNLKGAWIRYSELWISINGQDSWDLNPWVWIIDYKLIDKPKAKE